MTAAFILNDLLADKAQARVISYDAKFEESLSKPAPKEADYLREYLYSPPGVDTNAAAIVRFEIPLSAPELKPLRGRRRFRKNSSRFVDVTHAPLQDGEKEFYKKIAAPTWTGFKTAPARLARLTQTWASRNACILLNTAESATAWDGSNFLGTARKSNPFKKGSPTYKNYWAATDLNHTNIMAMRAEMAKRKDFAGDAMGLKGTTLFCSPELFPIAEALCLDERLAGGATNPLYKYKLVPKEFTHLSANRWGLIHDPAMEDYPLFAAIEGVEDFNTFGKDSAMFETSFEMGFDIVKDLGVALMRPEAFSLAITT